jgi:fructose-1,6-bisphosphatase/inositol monophosphatase family enzyme
VAADRLTEDPLALLAACADAVADVLARNVEWGLSGRRAGQYAVDLTADEAALRLLRAAGVSILSEESGFERGVVGAVVVLDPLDGSTNASRGIPWFATSLCLVDADGPAAALVVNQSSGVQYSAVRGGGARRDGVSLATSGCRVLRDAIVGVSGPPPPAPGWAQFRALGAAALDLCLVADGTLDGFVDCVADAHGVWDYLGGMLVCAEAGAVVSDAFDRELVVVEHAARRTPVAAATPELHSELVATRRRL